MCQPLAGQKTGDGGELFDNPVVRDVAQIMQPHLFKARAGGKQAPQFPIELGIHRIDDESIEHKFGLQASDSH